jgi:hypothetical protein
VRLVRECQAESVPRAQSDKRGPEVKHALWGPSAARAFAGVSRRKISALSASPWRFRKIKAFQSPIRNRSSHWRKSPFEAHAFGDLECRDERPRRRERPCDTALGIHSGVDRREWSALSDRHGRIGSSRHGRPMGTSIKTHSAFGNALSNSHAVLAIRYVSSPSSFETAIHPALQPSTPMCRMSFRRPTTF